LLLKVSNFAVLCVTFAFFAVWIWSTEVLNRKGRKDFAKDMQSKPMHAMTAEKSNSDKDGLAYRRVLLKISGEALMGEQNYGIDVDVARMVAEELKAVHHLGVQVAVVVGGGNIFRGVSKSACAMAASISSTSTPHSIPKLCCATR